MSCSNQIICYTSPHLSLHVPFFFLLVILTHCYVIVNSFYYPPLQAYLQYKKSLSNIIHLSHRQIQICRGYIMIRAVKENDLSAVMQIWLDINIKAHSFISKHYWMDNYDMVKKILPQAEIYVYENNGTKEIEGFIGLTDNYIAGLFVKEDMQSKGIGKQLLNYAKGIKSNMYLRVYNKNIRAIQFYQREQFVVQSENTDDNTNEKELVMAWSR